MEKKSILVADPSAELRLIFRQLIKRLAPPHRVLEAECGLEAIGHLQSQPVSMVFAETNLPKYCGVELLEWTIAAGLKVNFYLFFNDSVKYPHLRRSDVLRMGCTGLLAKPFNLKELEGIFKTF